MHFSYQYRNTPEDYWLFRMENYYRNWTGIVSIVFTVSMIILCASKWNDTNGLGRAIMILLVLLFPVFQPLMVYFTSIRDAQAIRVETGLDFNGTGMEIRVQNHVQRIPWKSFVLDDKGGGAVIKRRSMLVVVPDQVHAYLIPNRAAGSGEEKEEAYQFIRKMIESNVRG